MRWRRVRGTHPVLLAMAAVLAVQLLLRGWAACGSWFFQDDFFLTTQASHGLTLGFLFQEYSGHLMPGGLLVMWLVTRVAPLEWGLPVAVMLLLQLATGVVLARTMLLLLGRRAVAIVPLVVFALTPLTLNSVLWWGSGLQALPHQLALVVAVDGHLRYQRSRSRRYAVQSVLAVAVGLAFYEKVVLVPLLLVLLSVLPLASGRGWRRVTALRASRRYWAVHALVATSYSLLYLWLTRGPGGSASPPGDWVTVAGEALRTVAIGLAGGPWRAEGDMPVAAHAAPATLALVLALTALLAVVAWTVRRGGRRARDAWLALLAYLALDIGLLVAGRGELAPFLASDPRYYADAAPVAALALALAVQAVLAARRPSPAGSAVPTRAGAALAVAAAVVVAGSVQTTVVLADLAARNNARGYVDGMRAALQADPDLALADSPAAPVAIVDAFLGGQAAVSHVLGPLPEAERLRTPGQRVGVFTRNGRLIQGVELDPVLAARGPDDECGHRVTADPIAVGLPGSPVLEAGHVRLTYFTGASQRGVVEVAGRRHELLFRKGLHDWWIPVWGTVDEVVLHTSFAYPVALCVTEVAVMTMWPPGS